MPTFAEAEWPLLGWWSKVLSWRAMAQLVPATDSAAHAYRYAWCNALHIVGTNVTEAKQFAACVWSRHGDQWMCKTA